MIRFDVLFIILRPKECERAIAFESEPMCTGVTVRSKLDGRDPALADRYFLVSLLSIRYSPIFFLVGQPSSVKKNPLWPFLRFLSRKRLLRSIIRSSIRPSSSSFPRRPSLDLFSFSPTTGVPRSATLPHLSARGLPPDDDPGPQAENPSTSIFRNI